jgi:hypothetical protein
MRGRWAWKEQVGGKQICGAQPTQLSVTVAVQVSPCLQETQGIPAQRQLFAVSADYQAVSILPALPSASCSRTESRRCSVSTVGRKLALWS